MQFPGIFLGVVAWVGEEAAGEDPNRLRAADI